MKNENICTSCGTISDPKFKKKFSVIIFILLLIVFFPLAIVYIFCTAQSSKDKTVCPACEGNMISVKSPVGRSLYRQSMAEYNSMANENKSL